VVRVQWNAPAGDWQATNVQKPRMTGTAQTMQIITLPAGGDGVPYWEWRDQCGVEIAQYWFPNVFSANGFGRGFYQWEYVTVAGIEGRRAYYKDLYGAAVYGPAGQIRACPAQVGDPPPRSYDFYLIIEKVGGVETSWGEVFAQTTPTSTPVFYREAARQELQMSGDDSECWRYGSLEYPDLDASASPVMGACYTVSLAGDDGVEFAEVDASHDGYDATWLSFKSQDLFCELALGGYGRTPMAINAGADWWTWLGCCLSPVSQCICSCHDTEGTCGCSSHPCQA